MEIMSALACPLDLLGAQRAAMPPPKRVLLQWRRVVELPTQGVRLLRTVLGMAQSRHGIRAAGAEARPSFCVATIPRTECPLWVKSRHRGISNQCPLYPRKQTLELSRVMSAMCQKRTHAVQQTKRYSMTSSASASSLSGM